MFKRKYLMIIFILAALLFLAALPTMVAQASPASPVTFIVTQPDGTTFTAVQWGDENRNGLETGEGFSIERDPTSGYWYYLTAQLDGTLSSAYNDQGRLIVGRDLPTGLKKHLRPVAPADSPALSPEAVESPDSPPTIGTQKVLVLLAGFPNATGRSDPSYWSSLIFGGVGSLKDYYETVSGGAITIVPAAETSGTANDGVVGWLNLSAYYSVHPNPGSTVNATNKHISKDSLILANSFVNYAAFDTNGNGSISADELHIIVVVAGFERSYGGLDEPAVWAHNSDLSGSFDGIYVGSPTLDGKVLVNGGSGGFYSQVGEYHADHKGTMGVIAHNFGHDLRWPDLYDIDNSSFGVGNWSVMGAGSWNGFTYAGDSPAFPDAWLRWYAGWMTPTTISGYSYGHSIPSAESSPTAILLRPNTNGVDWLYRQHSGQGEYFLVENRQLTSYDSALPGCGLLIWHIDETVTASNSANANETHPLVKLIEADGLDQLKLKLNRGNIGDPYPGSSSNRNFTLYTTPNSKLYNGIDSFVRVTNISNCAATMTADLLYGYPVPSLDSLSPSYSAPSSSGFTLRLFGSDFYSNSIVRWNGSDRTTYYYSSNELRATITAGDMIALGGIGNSAAVTVFNPQPGGGVSDPRFYSIIDLSTIVPRAFLPLIFKNYKPGPGFIVLMQQGFEETYLSDKWEMLENGAGDYRWGRRGCRYASGSYSAWAVGGGADGGALICGSNYPNDADTSMTYGPFSTENGILNGEVKFKMFLNSETGFDYLWVTAGIGGSTEYGYKVSGNSSGWIDGTLNLKNVDGLGHSVIGLPKVWIRFRFTSDYLTSVGEGAFIDNIILRVCKDTNCTPTPSANLFPSMTDPLLSGDLIIEPTEFIVEP
ncbi:MAG: M6 family metalloprotease domain-containing protein [Anaerolineaceae bacterium]